MFHIRVEKEKLVDEVIEDDFGSGFAVISWLKLQWVEFDVNGKVLSRSEFPHIINGRAIQANHSLAFAHSEAKKCFLLVDRYTNSHVELAVQIESRRGFDFNVELSTKAMVLAIFERNGADTEWSVGTPGIPVDDSLDSWFSSPAALDVMKTWNSGLPNVAQDEMDEIAPEHHAYWLAYGRSDRVGGLYERFRDICDREQPTRFLKAVMMAWQDKRIDVARKTLVKKLIGDGARWQQLVQVDEKCHPVHALVELSSLYPTWCSTILACLDHDLILEYATTPEAADRLYLLYPNAVLLDYVSETVATEALEKHLGL
jgi:hypothetical protein